MILAGRIFPIFHLLRYLFGLIQNLVFSIFNYFSSRRKRNIAFFLSLNLNHLVTISRSRVHHFILSPETTGKMRLFQFQYVTKIMYGVCSQIDDKLKPSQQIISHKIFLQITVEKYSYKLQWKIFLEMREKSSIIGFCFQAIHDVTKW